MSTAPSRKPRLERLVNNGSELTLRCAPDVGVSRKKAATNYLDRFYQAANFSAFIRLSASRVSTGTKLRENGSTHPLGREASRLITPTLPGSEECTKSL